jgi:hypothetical protein
MLPDGLADSLLKQAHAQHTLPGCSGWDGAARQAGRHTRHLNHLPCCMPRSSVNGSAMMAFAEQALLVVLSSSSVLLQPAGLPQCGTL